MANNSTNLTFFAIGVSDRAEIAEDAGLATEIIIIIIVVVLLLLICFCGLVVFMMRPKKEPEAIPVMEEKIEVVVEDPAIAEREAARVKAEQDAALAKAEEDAVRAKAEEQAKQEREAQEKKEQESKEAEAKIPVAPTIETIPVIIRLPKYIPQADKSITQVFNEVSQMYEAEKVKQQAGGLLGCCQTEGAEMDFVEVAKGGDQLEPDF